MSGEDFMKIKRLFFVMVLLSLNVFGLYAQEILNHLSDMEILNPSIKHMILEIENHLSEIPADNNHVITKDYELLIDTFERYETKADEASGKRKMQEAIFYEDKKKNADLFIRKYRYSDGRDILAFSYTEQNIGKLQIKYLWNDAEKKYELCD